LYIFVFIGIYLVVLLLINNNYISVRFGKFIRKEKRRGIQLLKNWKKKNIFFSCLIRGV